MLVDVFSIEASRGHGRATDLCAILLEEAGRIHAIGDGAADKGEPMEDDGRLIGVLVQDLIGRIEEDRESDEAGEGNGNLRGQAETLELLRERMARDGVDEAHSLDCRGGGIGAGEAVRERRAGCGCAGRHARVLSRAAAEERMLKETGK